MLMAKVVTDLANRTPGKEAVAMESFAKALRMVRMCLCSLLKEHTVVLHVLTINPLSQFLFLLLQCFYVFVFLVQAESFLPVVIKFFPLFSAADHHR